MCRMEANFFNFVPIPKTTPTGQFYPAHLITTTELH